MNSNKKLHYNNSSLLVVQEGLPEENKIGMDAKLNLMNREKQVICSSEKEDCWWDIQCIYL